MMLLRLKSGRIFADTVGLRPGFFTSGVTEACSNFHEKESALKEGQIRQESSKLMQIKQKSLIL